MAQPLVKPQLKKQGVGANLSNLLNSASWFSSAPPAGAAPEMPAHVGAAPGFGPANLAQTPAAGLPLTGASAVPSAAAIAAGAGTGALQLSGGVKAVKGDKLNLGEQTALALPTFGLSYASNLIGSGKDKDQQGRDAGRGVMQQMGITDPKHMATTADGTQFDMGLDGSVKNYNVDFNREGIGDIVGLADPLGEIIARQGGGGDKLRSDMTGQIVNAATTSGDAAATLKSWYDKAGGYSGARGAIEGMTDLDPGRRDAYYASLDRLFGIGPPAQPTTAGGHKKNEGRPKPPEAPKPAPLTMEQMIPQAASTPPPKMPEPDDEPGQAEQDAVSQYAAMLKRMRGV